MFVPHSELNEFFIVISVILSPGFTIMLGVFIF